MHVCRHVANTMPEAYAVELLTPNYGVSKLSWQFIINSSVKFAVYERENFSPARDQEHGVTWNFMLSQALTKVAGCARMRKISKVCGSKCKAFSVSVLSHASVTPTFKYGRLLHACNWLKLIPMMTACITVEIFVFFFTCPLNLVTLWYTVHMHTVYL